MGKVVKKAAAAKPKPAPIPAQQSEQMDPMIRVERFIRLIPLGRRDGHYDGFQPELIEVINDRVTSRRLISKPNLYEYAFAIAADVLDPRNEVKYERAPV